MLARHLLVLLAAVLAAGRAEPAPVRPDAYLGFRLEPGVETKLVLAGGAEWRFAERASLFGGLALSAIDNPGVAHYGIGVAVRVLDRADVRLLTQVNHDEWLDWQAGENRVAGMVAARPLRGLELGAGAAWRAPIYDSGQYHSPFSWSSEAPEWNWVYRLDWTFLDRERYEAAFWLTNIDRLTIHNPQQFPAGLRASYAAWPRWRLTAQLGTGIKGLSALLFAFTEMDLRLGVTGEL
jgi:hypothetical protein